MQLVDQRAVGQQPRAVHRVERDPFGVTLVQPWSVGVGHEHPAVPQVRGLVRDEGAPLLKLACVGCAIGLRERKPQHVAFGVVAVIAEVAAAGRTEHHDGGLPAGRAAGRARVGVPGDRARAANGIGDHLWQRRIVHPQQAARLRHRRVAEEDVLLRVLGAQPLV